MKGHKPKAEERHKKSVTIKTQFYLKARNVFALADQVQWRVSEFAHSSQTVLWPRNNMNKKSIKDI